MQIKTILKSIRSRLSIFGANKTLTLFLFPLIFGTIGLVILQLSHAATVSNSVEQYPVYVREASSTSTSTPVYVENISTISASRRDYLLNVASRSLCTKQPTTIYCDSLVEGNDRFILSDHYLVWIDMTSHAGDYGNGGGGLVRGLWLLKGSGNTTSFMHSYANNFAPNNLYVCQIVTPNCSGDAYELVVAPVGAEAQGHPELDYRTSDSPDSAVSISSPASGSGPNWHLQVHGRMANSFGFTNYAFTPKTSSTWLYYNIDYHFYNNYSSASTSNKYPIDIRASIDMCGNCSGSPKPMVTSVFSVGLSADTNTNLQQRHDLVLDNFKPVNGDAYSQTASCAQGQIYPAGGVYSNNNIAETHSTDYDIKIKSQAGTDLSGNKLHVALAQVSGYNAYGGPAPKIAGMVYQQYFHDRGNHLYVFDQKIGDPNQCGTITLKNGQSFAFHQRLGLDYEQP
ncbi:MAG TPA: hypothetical protein VLF39_02550 [Candidatus Saccharimonadales bacterium]|nr:hypothetical protein [Candidatus Saccharimonadales bacterium]